MKFKSLILCFNIFVVLASGATVCKGGADEKKDTVPEFKVKVKFGNSELDETIRIDTEKGTETFHITSGALDTSTGAADVVYDFKQGVAMYLPPNSKACFLSYSTDNLPKPAELKKMLETESNRQPNQGEIEEEINYVVSGTVVNRSFLSDEMANMCAKLPIFRVKPKNFMVDVEKETRLHRIKRRICAIRFIKTCSYGRKPDLTFGFLCTKISVWFCKSLSG